MNKHIKSTIAVLTLFLLPLASYGHLMPVNRGTLNVLGDNIFMVLSLPTLSFSFIDENDDGKISQTEFKRNHQSLIQHVKKNVVLLGKSRKIELKDIMLTPVLSHKDKSVIEQFTVMGKYSIFSDDRDQLYFSSSLSSSGSSQQDLALFLIEKAKNIRLKYQVKHGETVQLFNDRNLIKS